MARGGAFIRRRARLDLSADEDDEVFEEGDAAEEHGDGDRDRMREGIHLKYRWFNFWLDHASMHINDRIARLCDLYKARYLPSFYTGRNNISENFTGRGHAGYDNNNNNNSWRGHSRGLSTSHRRRY